MIGLILNLWLYSLITFVFLIFLGGSMSAFWEWTHSFFKRNKEDLEKREDYIKKTEEYLVESQKRIEESEKKHKDQEARVGEIIKKIEKWKELEALHENDSNKAFHVIISKNKNETDNPNHYKGPNHIIGGLNS